MNEIPIRITEFINRHQWRFAKSMPHMPHWYVVRAECDSDDDFVYFVEFIREHGYDRTFGGRTYKYLNVGMMCYWTMGNPIIETTILNRAVYK